MCQICLDLAALSSTFLLDFVSVCPLVRQTSSQLSSVGLLTSSCVIFAKGRLDGLSFFKFLLHLRYMSCGVSAFRAFCFQGR